MSEKITWGIFHDLAVQIDAVAVTMDTPDYANLVDDNTTPFSLTDKVTKSFTYWFDVWNNGDEYPTVTYEYIRTSPTGGALTLPDPLKQLAANGNLYFVADETPAGATSSNCWCKTIFKVKVLDDGNYSLLKIGDGDPICSCGCVTTKVPAIGEDLDTSQHFIPTGWAKFYNPGIDDDPDLGTIEKAEPRCKADTADGAHFHFTQGSPNTHYDLEGCGRDMTGYLTWPIRQKWMQAYLTKIQQILGHSCGAKPVGDSGLSNIICGTPDCPTSATTYLPPYHSVLDIDISNTLCKTNTTYQSQSGCLCCMGAGYPIYGPPGSGGPSLTPSCLPWNASCCSGDKCDSNGYKVYKATMDQFKDYVTKIPLWVEPYDATKTPYGLCNPCIYDVSKGTLTLLLSGFNDWSTTSGTTTNHFTWSGVNKAYTFPSVAPPGPPIPSSLHCSDEIFGGVIGSTTAAGTLTMTQSDTTPGFIPPDPVIWTGSVLLSGYWDNSEVNSWMRLLMTCGSVGL